jgi:hypothetical protein
MTIRYAIWRDDQEDNYCIIHWDDSEINCDPVVQTGIRTKEEAQAVQRTWKEREANRRP